MTRYSYTKDQLESLAEQINLQYFPERMAAPIALDPYDLIDKIGCNVEWKYISPDESILGMTIFDNVNWPVWSCGEYQSGMMPQVEYFKIGTIVINQVVLDRKKRADENFVVTHEIAHWIKDKQYFQSLQTHGIVHLCNQNDFNVFSKYNTDFVLNVVEKQANYLAAAILMPKDVLKNEFFKLCRYRNIPQKPIPIQNYMKAHIATLAKKFDVNYSPVLYRLKEIGVLC